METIVVIDDDFTVEVISDDEEIENLQEHNKAQLDWDMENNSDFELGKHVHIKEEIDIDDEYHYLMFDQYVDLMQIKTEIQSDTEENDVCFEENCVVEETNLEENPPIPNLPSESPQRENQNFIEENSANLEENPAQTITSETVQGSNIPKAAISSKENEILPNLPQETPQIEENQTLEEHHNEKEVSLPENSTNESLNDNPEKEPLLSKNLSNETLNDNPETEPSPAENLSSEHLKNNPEKDILLCEKSSSEPLTNNPEKEVLLPEKSSNEPLKDKSLPGITNNSVEKENSHSPSKQTQNLITSQPPVKEKKLENAVVRFSKAPHDRRESEWKGKSRKTPPDHRYDKSVIPYKSRRNRDRRSQKYRNRQLERFDNNVVQRSFSRERYRPSKSGKNYYENKIDYRSWNNYNNFNNMQPPPMDGVRNQIYTTILNALNQIVEQNQPQVGCNNRSVPFSATNTNYQFSQYQRHQFRRRPDAWADNFKNRQFQCSTQLQTYTTILQAVTHLNNGSVTQNSQNFVTNDIRLQMSVSNVFRSI